MKRLFAILLFALIPMISFGAGGVDQIRQQQMNLMQDSALIDAMAKRLAKSFPEHREELRQMFSDKHKEYEAEERDGGRIQGGFAKFVELLAQKVYKEIQAEEIEKIKQHSRQTGRKIKTDPEGINIDDLANGKWPEGEDIIFIWLDEGYLDSDACVPNDWYNCVDKNETFECYANEAKKWCLYPNNFEVHDMYLVENSSLARIMDDKTKNETTSIDVVMMHSHSSSKYGNESSTSFEIYNNVSDYDKYAAARNRSQQALRDGGFLFMTYCGWYGDKDPKCKDIINKEWAEFYPNGDNTWPAYRTMGDSYDYSVFESKPQKKEMPQFTKKTQKLLEKNGVTFDEKGHFLRNTNSQFERHVAQKTMNEVRQNDRVSFDNPAAINKNIQMQNDWQRNNPAQNVNTLKPMGMPMGTPNKWH